jgi:hypothetical protein
MDFNTVLLKLFFGLLCWFYHWRHATACKFSLICLVCKAGMVANQFWFRPEPLFLPPPDSLLTVAQARASAVFVLTPFFS